MLLSERVGGLGIEITYSRSIRQIHRDSIDLLPTRIHTVPDYLILCICQGTGPSREYGDMGTFPWDQ